MTRLELTVPSRPVIHGEPVVVQMRLVNEGSAIPFPFEYSALDVATFRLFDSSGTLLQEANGYTRDERLGHEPRPQSSDTLKTAELPAGAVAEWEDDLLGYMDLPGPGEFLVSVRFRFAPALLDLESDRKSFQVQPLQCRWLDVLEDRVAMQVLHTVQQHAGAGDTRAIFHFRSVQEPGTTWWGCSVDGAPQTRPQISEADFVDHTTFAHDFTRWIAWLSNDVLTLARVLDHNNPLVVRHELKHAELAGRPVQHRDGSVSILTLDRSGQNGSMLRDLQFDVDGVQTGAETLGTITGHSELMTCAYDQSHRLFVLALGGDPFAIWLYRRVADVLELVPLKNSGDFGAVQPLRVRLRLKGRRQYPLALWLALDRDEGKERAIWGVARLGDGPNEEAEWRRHQVSFDQFGLEGDTVLEGDILPNVAGDVYAAFLMSSGRILVVHGEGDVIVKADRVTAASDSLTLVQAASTLLVTYAEPTSGFRCLPAE